VSAMTHILIDMRTYKAIYRADGPDAAAKVDEAHGMAAPPAHAVEVGGTWPAFSGVDLVRFFNALPGVSPVRRFENRAIAVRRVNEALAAFGDQLPPYGAVAASPEAETTMAKPISKTEQESAPVATKTKKAKTKTPDSAAVELTAAGKKDDQKFNAGSSRGRVFDAIKRVEGGIIELAELVKKCSHFAKRGQVVGCVAKLRAAGLVK
jgi:hypothetical protein